MAKQRRVGAGGESLAPYPSVSTYFKAPTSISSASPNLSINTITRGMEKKRIREEEEKEEDTTRSSRKGKKRIHEEEEEEDADSVMCGICLLEEGKVVRGQIDCCNHYFCYVCIMEWAKKESLCPMCKQRFRSIRRPPKDGVFACERIFEVPVRDQVYNPLRNYLRRPSNTHACVYCTECQSSEDECLLLCDLCNSAMHTFCVGLGVTVPEGNWYCHDCTVARNEHTKRQLCSSTEAISTSSSSSMTHCAHNVFVKMPPKMKKATPRPSKRGRSSSASSSRPSEFSPNVSQSPSPSHPSNILKPSSNILDCLLERPIIVERRVLVDQIKNYDMRAVVGRVGWQGILYWGDNAYPSLVRNMYASISSTNVSENSCSFTISFIDRDEVITPERIGTIMGIPCSQNGITFVSDSLSKEERGVATRDLCGFDCIWDPRKHHLTIFSLIPINRIIHNIFTHNVYPRMGNRTELTTFMVSILSKVVTSTPICLPSLICQAIIRFHITPAQKNAIPFGYLMTQLALSFGIPKPQGEKPLFKVPFSMANLNQMNLIPNNHVPIANDPPLAQQPPRPPHPPPHASSSRHSSSPRPASSSSTNDRLEAIERDIACIKKEQKKNEKTMNKIFKYVSEIAKSCRRDDVAAPSSPSPPPPDSD